MYTDSDASADQPPRNSSRQGSRSRQHTQGTEAKVYQRNEAELEEIHEDNSQVLNQLENLKPFCPQDLSPEIWPDYQAAIYVRRLPFLEQIAKSCPTRLEKLIYQLPVRDTEFTKTRLETMIKVIHHIQDIVREQQQLLREWLLAQSNKPRWQADLLSQALQQREELRSHSGSRQGRTQHRSGSQMTNEPARATRQSSQSSQLRFESPQRDDIQRMRSSSSRRKAA